MIFQESVKTFTIELNMSNHQGAPGNPPLTAWNIWQSDSIHQMCFEQL